MSPNPWTPREKKLLGRFDSPLRIQQFLDSIPYSDDPIYRCPRRVMKDRKAHCYDGALFAAAALRRLGHRPLLIDLRAVRDDDHILAPFWQNGRLGAVAKSNFVGLRFREPIHRNVRELVLTYFEDYYNTDGEKTLRSYSGPLDVGAFDRLDWLTRDEPMDAIAKRLDSARHFRLLTKPMERTLSPKDKRSYQAGMLGTLASGLYGAKG
ncbi:MAG: hypothetical protein ACYC8T_05235 [Myxococcaceae bacterium]